MVENNVDKNIICALYARIIEEGNKSLMGEIIRVTSGSFNPIIPFSVHFISSQIIILLFNNVMFFCLLL